MGSAVLCAAAVLTTVLRTEPTFDGPLDATDAPGVAELGRVLIAHGFAGDAVIAALGTPPAGGKSHARDDAPLYLRRLADRMPLNTLIKLFVLRQTVDEAAARDALAPLGLERVERMGVLERVPAGVVARVRISGCSGLVLAHDSYDPRSSLSRDHVLDVNPTTNTLAALTVRRPVRTALDVGTGCGVLALMVARHSLRVVGIDTNARALNFATFNAALNGLKNVEFRQGSLFDPVEGERFDLIVCNPPPPNRASSSATAIAAAMPCAKRWSAARPSISHPADMPRSSATGGLPRARSGRRRCEPGLPGQVATRGCSAAACRIR